MKRESEFIKSLTEKIITRKKIRKNTRSQIKFLVRKEALDLLKNQLAPLNANLNFATEHMLDEVQKWQQKLPDFSVDGNFDQPSLEKVFKVYKQRYDAEKQLMLAKYMGRVRRSAADKMLRDEKFAERFVETERFDAVILSVDIRRSTDLMLKCKSPEIYAEFINLLTQRLMDAVKSHYGIYDKFTGDGLLAIFPKFYSGPEAVNHAILCAIDCQKIFQILFKEYKKHFEIGSMETGLGSGIDFGNVYRAGVDMEYTVVGTPVVYACRFSNAPAGHIYLTQNAMDSFLGTDMHTVITPKEASIPIKHENPQCAWDVECSAELNLDSIDMTSYAPEWTRE